MKESGQFDKLSRVWLEKPKQICEGQGAESLGIGMLYTLFVLLLFSTFVSALILCYERRPRRRKEEEAQQLEEQPEQPTVERVSSSPSYLQ